MESSEFPATDSGYPTPREDIPLSSRAESPPGSPNVIPMTSTPLRGARHHPIRDPLGPRSQSLVEELSTIDEADTSGLVMQNVRSLLSLAKEVKWKKRENTALREENYTLRDENESLREENFSLREDSKRTELENASLRHDHEEGVSPPAVPKLLFNQEELEPVMTETAKHSDNIKKEIISFVKDDEKEGKLEHMFIPDANNQKVNIATATIQIDIEKIDADVQTDKDDHINVINANLKIEVDQLHSQLEVTEREKSDLENRLFDFEKLKVQFEEDEEKLKRDLERKLKNDQEKIVRCEAKIAELELRLSKKRKELEAVSAENQRLVEDRNTHDFEIDEIKIHLEEVEKKLKATEQRVGLLKKEINSLEEKLEEEKEAKEDVEKKSEETRKEFQEVVERLKRQADEALDSEDKAKRQLEEAQMEVTKILKENKYLSDAQQVLLDSEMGLKNEVSVMTATIRNIQQQLDNLQEELFNEKRRREEADADNLDLGLKNQQLEDEKQDASEMLKKLTEGKREIEYLRQQIHLVSQESDEMRQLRNEFQETQQRTQELEKKLVNAEKKEKEFIGKHEQNIRASASKDVELEHLKEEVAKQKDKINECNSALKHAEKLVDDLRNSNDALNQEYSEFRTHANLQYEHEVRLRDEEIAMLHRRLVELETYPGQTVSVSRRNTEVQTEEPIPTPVLEEKSPDVTLVDEEHQKLEKNIQKLIGQMENFIQGRNLASLPPSFQSEPGTEYECAEVFRNFVEILNELQTTSEAPIDRIIRFWKTLNERMQLYETVLSEKLIAAKKAAAEEINRIDLDYTKRIKELKKEFREMEKLAEQRLYLADEFRAQYEAEVREREEQVADYARLDEVRQQELLEWEKSDKSLRERLERAEHKEQQYTRERITRVGKHEEEVDELRSRFGEVEKDLRSRIRKAEAELAEVTKRREYDRASMSSMMKDFDKVTEKVAYLRKRNNERQQMLNDMKIVLIKCQQTADPNETKHYIDKFTEKLNKSGLLTINRFETAPGSSDNSNEKIDELRRALSNINRQK